MYGNVPSPRLNEYFTPSQSKESIPAILLVSSSMVSEFLMQGDLDHNILHI